MVLLGRRSQSRSRKTRTEADGSFYIAGCKPGKNLLTADADGYAATTIEVTLGENSEPFHLTLNHGNLLKLRVVDQSGNPLPNAIVWLDTVQRGPLNLTEERPVPPQIEFNRKTGRTARASSGKPGSKVLSETPAAIERSR